MQRKTRMDNAVTDFVGIGRDQVAHLKELLVERVEYQAEWRAQKAEEYPDDAARNIAASEDLLALADSLKSIAGDDPLWLAYACGAHDDDDAFLLSERESEVLGDIGFRQAAPDGREFLRELVQGAEQEAAAS